MKGRKLGWIPDYPNINHYTQEHPEMQKLIAKLAPKPAPLPTVVDLSPHCSPVEDQLSIGSCCAHGACGAIEYGEIKAYGKYVRASRLFVYRTVRDLMQLTGDSGASISSVLGAITVFGAPPETYMPYTDEDGWDTEPSAFCYGFGQKYSVLKYFKHDPPGSVAANVLTSIKTYLVSAIPVIAGFTVYGSYVQADKTGDFPYPAPGEQVEGGHCVLIVGYDNLKKITNTSNKQTSVGAFKIRNSWGTSWGAHGGYGYLPYDYLLKGGLIQDFWSVINESWLDISGFNFSG